MAFWEQETGKRKSNPGCLDTAALKAGSALPLEKSLRTAWKYLIIDFVPLIDSASQSWSLLPPQAVLPGGELFTGKSRELQALEEVVLSSSGCSWNHPVGSAGVSDKILCYSFPYPHMPIYRTTRGNVQPKSRVDSISSLPKTFQKSPLS